MKLKAWPVESRSVVTRRPRQRSIIQSILVSRCSVTRPVTHQSGRRNRFAQHTHRKSIGWLTAAGVPLSVARVVIWKEPESLGDQLMIPLFMATPRGAPSKVYVRRFVGGVSTSTAMLVTVNVPPTPMSCAAIGGKTGAWFVLITLRVKLCVALRLGEPLSKARKVIMILVGVALRLGRASRKRCRSSSPAPHGRSSSPD